MFRKLRVGDCCYKKSVHSVTMGIEHYTKLCDKLRAKSHGVMAELDHSALVLEDGNISRFADALWNSHQPVPVLSLNLSRIGTSKRRNGAASGSTWLPDGLDRLMHYIRTSPHLVDVRLSGSEYDTATRPTILYTVVTHFIEAIENNPSIRRLGLFHVGLEAESLARHVRRTRTLLHLSLVRCSLYKRAVNGQCDEKLSVCSQKMAASFALNKSITSLRLIDLDENITVSILEQLKVHTSLQKLDLSCNSPAITSMVGQLTIGTTAVSSHLNHLILRDSDLQGFESIVRFLTCGKSCLHRLDVVNCSIDTVSASLFRTLFRSTKHILRHVSFCGILLIDDTSLEELFDGILYSKTINQLTLHRVALQDHDYQALNHLLQTNKYLTQVNLDRTILAHLKSQRKRSNSDMQIPTEPQQCGDYLFSRESGKLSHFMGGTLTTV